MEEMIEARVSPKEVWKAWERAIEEGKGKKGCQVIDIQDGKSFSILWKTLFVRLIFRHSVQGIEKGARIHYQVQIRGLFAWPVRWILGGKIKKNLQAVLKATARDLETKRVKEPESRGSPQGVSRQKPL